MIGPSINGHLHDSERLRFLGIPESQVNDDPKEPAPHNLHKDFNEVSGLSTVGGEGDCQPVHANPRRG